MDLGQSFGGSKKFMKGSVLIETLLMCRWGGETPKVGIKQVDLAQTSHLNIGRRPSSKRMKRRLTLERFFVFSLRWNSDSYQPVRYQISCNVMSSVVIAFANDGRPTALDIESSFILRIMDHWHKWRRTCYSYVFMLIKAAGLTLI